MARREKLLLSMAAEISGDSDTAEGLGRCSSGEPAYRYHYINTTTRPDHKEAKLSGIVGANCKVYLNFPAFAPMAEI